ncbi:hypothetical protein TREMEDRAFT_70155 [Tremella mesenterica DSM 1558]|uniref:uncharacterized protein n=1 Tax=Tremella mesenterica (strain ATCC 24925 / CBS 8224 / DSM 1558 / NBRC 9311 / NRRL Y-6157 / RJB 2259-6 / UBC 559-6) TaxID=578456 RepID=UPI00032BC9F7|nr:uncharacterized protein TREMEDRAFT_70155 [Tremella mesenterica DSM 1558]EIW66591.1 hypothetical protein TREMEDRAFT_70155 [Tremella mesenterica DSM 1558]
MIATILPPAIPLGGTVPAMTAHAISVSLPTWEDNVDYEKGNKRVLDAMETGYPRFFIHRSIQKLAALCLNKFGRPDELCILLPSPRVATQARDFLSTQKPSLPSRIVEFVICPSISSLPPEPCTPSGTSSVDIIELQILLFDKSHWSTAKSFWQHTGDGISSRMAETALNLLGEFTPISNLTSPMMEKRETKPYSRNRHYSRKSSTPTSISPTTPLTPIVTTPLQSRQIDEELLNEENLTTELTTYLEERYGRNLPLFNAGLAKQALKRRIAGGLLPSDEDFGKIDDVARAGGAGKKAVSEEDVFLYPTGMSAIWHAHEVCRVAKRRSGGQEGKSVCYGFPYTDTIKILTKWGPGCHFFPTGGNQDIPSLEKVLELKSSDEPPILALFCEFPSNPLLTSPDLVAIRKLADKYGFVVVVDETVGNFINVEVAAFADIVVSSLTKIFSGDANVMGGSLILNPNSSHYTILKETLSTIYEDLYFPEDAVYMERNSRDYRSRIKTINDNAHLVTEYLYHHSLSNPSHPSQTIIKKVYYPRWITPETYVQSQRLPTLGKGGFGGLFSLTFTSMIASRAFFDALPCAKGPSLGTSFTLASPYTILAHYYELDWAAGCGVEEGLVRISVGQEEEDVVMAMFQVALKAAERAVVEESGRGR